MQYGYKRRPSGFTPIELVIVIVILGILAVTALPWFVHFSADADEANFNGTVAAFEEGVKQVHFAWLIRGQGQAVQEFIPIPEPQVGGNLSVNANGFPVETRGVSLTLNSTDDCIDVWRAVLSTQDAGVSGSEDEIYTATYNGDFSCTYQYNSQPALNAYYNSITGDVTAISLDNG